MWQICHSRLHRQGFALGFEVEGTAPIAAGAPIAHDARPAAGAVTSAIADPDRGVTLALGYLHRTVSEPGGTVTIDGRRAQVHELPW